jgi:hypothetical protein
MTHLDLSRVKSRPHFAACKIIIFIVFGSNNGLDKDAREKCPRTRQTDRDSNEKECE